eukprot:g900.t1
MGGSGGGDPTGGGLLVVIALVEGIIFKTVLKKLPLPYTCIMLIMGVLTGLMLQYGKCEYVGSVDSDDTTNQSAICESMARGICTNSLHELRGELSHENYCAWKATISNLGPVGNTVDLWTSIDPHLVMYTFLPPLIYGATVHVNVHVFKKTLGQILPLAGPGVLLATFLTASFTKLYIGDEYHWSTWTYLTFGAMLSATDPVAVVALLSESSAPPKLGIIIEGESLFNDGTALAVFLICFEGIKGNEESLGGALIFFSRLAVGGMLMGILMGQIMLYILKYLQEPLLEVIITLIFSYGTFFVAEQESVHVSGVIALVFLGLCMASSGKPLLTSEDMMHHFWEMMDFIANTVVFHVSGLIIAETVMDEHITSVDWGFLFVLFLALLVIRSLTLLCLSPMLFVSGYGVSWYELIFVSWSGLRGAVGLALGMMVEATANSDISCASAFDFEDSSCSPGDKDYLRARMLFHMAGIATLTLVINGTTGDFFLSFLGLERRSNASLLSYDAAARLVSMRNVKRLKELSKQPFFKSMDKDIVWDHMPIFSEEILHERNSSKSISKERYERMLHSSAIIRTLRQRYGIMEPSLILRKPNVVVPIDFDNVEIGWPDHWDQFDASQKHQLYRKYWGQILEQRLRFVSMLEANLWHSFESGAISVSTVLHLLELCGCTRDRVKRAPKKAPENALERAKCTTNSWPMLEPQLMPSVFDHLIQKFLENTCFVSAARRRLYRRINAMLDITRGFISAHKHAIEIMEHSITELANSLDKDEHDDDVEEIHSLHPVVLELVIQEAHRAEFAASKFYQEISSGESGMMTRSIATNHVIRQLLTDATNSINKMYHSGQIDSVEKLTMMRSVHTSRRRLLMNPVFQKPPTTEDMLKGMGLFSGMKNEAMQIILSNVKEKHVHVNTVLYSQDDAADCIYVLLSGCVSLHIKSKAPVASGSPRSGKKTKRASLVVMAGFAAAKFTKILQKGKSLAVSSPKSEATKEEDPRPMRNTKSKKRRRLSMQDDGIMEARQLTTDDLESEHGAEMLRLKAGHVLGTLSMMRGSKRLMTAVARDTMAVVVAIPKSVVGQCFHDEISTTSMLRVQTTKSNTSRKKSLWLYGADDEGTGDVTTSASSDVLILSASTPQSGAQDSSTFVGRKRRSLFGAAKRRSLTNKASSESAPAKRLSLSRRARRSLVRSKTHRGRKEKECPAQRLTRIKHETKLTKIESKVSFSEDTKPAKKMDRRGSFVAVAAKLTKQSFRRVASFVNMDKYVIHRMEGNLCKEAAAVAAKAFLGPHFLGMDHEDAVEMLQRSIFVRTTNNQRIILKDSAILLTGCVVEPVYMQTRSEIAFLKVDDDEREEGVHFTVGVDVNGNLPRLLVVPPRSLGSTGTTTRKMSLFGGTSKGARRRTRFSLFRKKST